MSPATAVCYCDYYQSESLHCCHVWEATRRFTTWTSSDCTTEVPSWACWYIDYECVICGEVVTLPEGQKPNGGFVCGGSPPSAV